MFKVSCEQGGSTATERIQKNRFIPAEFFGLDANGRK
jgi:hypothetical protein